MATRSADISSPTPALRRGYPGLRRGYPGVSDAVFVEETLDVARVELSSAFGDFFTGTAEVCSNLLPGGG